jgi:hypothetical protein
MSVLNQSNMPSLKFALLSTLLQLRLKHAFFPTKDKVIKVYNPSWLNRYINPYPISTKKIKIRRAKRKLFSKESFD